MLEKEQLKILIADDDNAIRLALVTMLQSEGYSTVEAVDGEAAIEAFNREQPDIVLLDTVMPKKHGYAVCQYIRTLQPDIHELPVLIITVLDDPDWIQKAQEAGASDYLTKPISLPLLMYRMDMLFMRKKLMRERNKLERQLRESHKLNAIRQLTGGFAHDFNNILAAQLGYTELALNHANNSGDEKIQHYLGEVQKASLRAKLLIEQLITFTMEEIDLTSVSMISDVFCESIKALIKSIPAGIDFESSNDIQNGWIPLDFVQFHQVIMNLLENAVDAIEGKGRISISLTQSGVKDRNCSSCLQGFSGNYFVLTCEDNGRGIEPAIVHRIFEPFYSTKPVGKGTGHGMSIIHGIVHAAGGHIVIESEPGRGTVTRIFFKPIRHDDETSANSAQDDGPIKQVT